MTSLEPITLNSSKEAQDLLDKISAMIQRGEVKIIKGSLNSSVIDMEFKVKGTTDRWSIRGVMDAHGQIALSRI